MSTYFRVESTSLASPIYIQEILRLRPLILLLDLMLKSSFVTTQIRCFATMVLKNIATKARMVVLERKLGGSNWPWHIYYKAALQVSIADDYVGDSVVLVHHAATRASNSYLTRSGALSASMCCGVVLEQALLLLRV